ncbi:MAG: extracellular solute-binding protein [Limnochordia bacterium]
MSIWINEVAHIENTQKILDQYMMANPGIQMGLIQQPWNGYHDKLIALVAGGVAPDVMVLSRLYVPSFATNGIIQPIDQWLAKDAIDVARDISEMNSGTWDGHRYGIPIMGGPGIVLVNEDLFQTMGLPTPIEYARNRDWTWDRVIELGKKITRDVDGDGRLDVFALPQPGTNAWDWYGKIRVFGGEVIRNNRAVIDSPEAQRGLELFRDVSLTHHIAPQPGDSANFERGTQALRYAWTSEAPNIAKRVDGAFPVDLVTMPTGPAGAFHVAGGCPVTVSATTAYPEEAYKFAVWFAMDSDFWKLLGIPASMNVIRREYRSYLAEFFKSPDVPIEALMGPTAVEPQTHLHSSELSGGWNPILTSLSQGRISPAEAAVQITRHINAVLGAQ